MIYNHRYRVNKESNYGQLSYYLRVACESFLKNSAFRYEEWNHYGIDGTRIKLLDKQLINLF